MSISGRKKIDMMKAVQQTVDGTPVTELLEEHGAGYIMNKRKIDELATNVAEEAEMKRLKAEFSDAKLRSWQQEALDMLESQNRRQILFVIDVIGNTGKSWLADYLVANKGAFCTENESTADLKYAYSKHRGEYIVFDIARSTMDYVNYDVMECLKNGRFMNTKFESKMCVYGGIRKMIVMLNNEPNPIALSHDRYTKLYPVDYE